MFLIKKMAEDFNKKLDILGNTFLHFVAEVDEKIDISLTSVP